jgi:transposase
MPRKKPPKRRAFETDLSDGRWALIEPLIPRGCPRNRSTRDLIEAILDMLRAGSSWRLLPHELPQWQTVYYCVRRWQREGVWNRVH